MINFPCGTKPVSRVANNSEIRFILPAHGASHIIIEDIMNICLCVTISITKSCNLRYYELLEEKLYLGENTLPKRHDVTISSQLLVISVSHPWLCSRELQVLTNFKERWVFLSLRFHYCLYWSHGEAGFTALWFVTSLVSKHVTLFGVGTKNARFEYDRKRWVQLFREQRIIIYVYNIHYRPYHCECRLDGYVQHTSEITGFVSTSSRKIKKYRNACVVNLKCDWKYLSKFA